jgi:hypothetical protein
LAAVKRHAGKLDEAVGALSHADDAATATATGVRESIEEASSVLAKEGGGAANSADELFEIGEGVRRSKAAEILKKESIPARIIREGQADELRDLPLTSLRSPREVINASTLTDAERMASVLEGTRKGTVPPIDVRPGSRGTPIKDVKIKYPGSR